MDHVEDSQRRFSWCFAVGRVRDLIAGGGWLPRGAALTSCRVLVSGTMLDRTWLDPRALDPLSGWRGKPSGEPFVPVRTGWGMTALASEVEVVSRAADQGAVTRPDFAAFYAEQWSDVAGFCAALVGSTSAGDEMAQEAFTRLCSRWRFISEPRPYVFRIARNLAHRHWRHGAHEVLVASLPEAAAAGTGTDPHVLDAVRGLPERLRVVVLMHYYADLPLEEISAALRRPLGSIKRQLHEARGILSRTLGEPHD